MAGYREKADLSMKELKEVFDMMDESYVRPLVDAVKKYDRIFTIGAGREGLSTKAFAMRLMHLGKEEK